MAAIASTTLGEMHDERLDNAGMIIARAVNKMCESEDGRCSTCDRGQRERASLAPTCPKLVSNIALCCWRQRSD
ncbi:MULTISPECIES: hypothetical protein [unclassified Bradyrhizobium]